MALIQGHFNYFNYKLKIYFTFGVRKVEFFHLLQILLGTQYFNLKAEKVKDMMMWY